MSELHQAAASGDADLVEEILRKNLYDPNERDVDWNNRTPLHWAAARGQAEMVRVLIEHGARPCLRTRSGWTAAHFAAEAGRLQVLRMLHVFHTSLDKEDCCGDKPVRIAEVYGNKECVQFLKRHDTLGNARQALDICDNSKFFCLGHGQAEAEHQEYRRSAMLSGLSLDDTDEEWEGPEQAIVHQRMPKSMNTYTPQIKSKV